MLGGDFGRIGAVSYPDVNSMQRETQKHIIMEFLGRERARLIRFVLRRFHDVSEMDAEDLIQDLILNFFDKTDPSMHLENLGAYIYRSLSNRVIDWLRKNKRQAVTEEWVDGIDGKRVAATGCEDVFDLSILMEREEVRTRIVRALDELEPRQRAIWIATEVDGYSFKELSVIWNEPMGTLLSRKHRAMKALQMMLKDLKRSNQ